jgi:hypothetical protein
MMSKENLIEIEDIFSTLPNEDFWKLIIDYEYWDKNDELFFDKQESPGYLKNTSTALLYLFETINQPVTLEFIIKLHDIAYHEKTEKYLGLKTFGSSGLTDESVTLDGLKELLNKIKKREVNNFKKKYLIDIEDITAEEIFANLTNNFWPHLFIERHSNLADVQAEINNLLIQYNESIEHAKSEKDQLIAIATLIQALHQYHPFNDGNGRTFIFLLLNKLLIGNDLSVTTVESPGRFSGYSVLELVEEIQKGQMNFRDISTEEKVKDISFQEYIKQRIGGKSHKSYVENLGIFNTSKNQLPNEQTDTSYEDSQGPKNA